MENITQGHWIFAGIFALLFVVGIAWAYKSDAKTHKVHYKGFYLFFAAIIICVFLLFVFKDFLR
jgi:cytochrome c biogenesis factor